MIIPKKMNVNQIEFRNRVKNDGKIIIKNETIYKDKPFKYLTIDLQYDSINNIFIDFERNIYKMKKI